MLNPQAAYQNPIAEAGRKLRAATETIEDEKAAILWSQLVSAFVQELWETPLRGVGPKSRVFTSNNHLSRGIVQ